MRVSPRSEKRCPLFLFRRRCRSHKLSSHSPGRIPSQMRHMVNVPVDPAEPEPLDQAVDVDGYESRKEDQRLQTLRYSRLKRPDADAPVLVDAAPCGNDRCKSTAAAHGEIGPLLEYDRVKDEDI